MLWKNWLDLDKIYWFLQTAHTSLLLLSEAKYVDKNRVSYMCVCVCVVFQEDYFKPETSLAILQKIVVCFSMDQW